MHEKSRDWLGGLASLFITFGVLALLSINLWLIPSKGLTSEAAFFAPGPLLLEWAKIGNWYGLLYILLGCLQIIQVLKVYDYLQTNKEWIRFGTLWGLMSGVLFAASGGLYLYGGRAMAQAYPAHPEVALNLFHTVISAAAGVAFPADITISLWGLTIGVIGWRSKGLPIGLCIIAFLMGSANILAQLFALVPFAIIAFVLSPILSLWLAILFLRRQSS